MKKIKKTMWQKVLIVSGLMIFSVTLNNIAAQEKIGTYSMSALNNSEGDEFGIWIAPGDNVWIDAYSTYNPKNRCGIKVNERDLPNFITTIKNAKDLYSEWKKISIENKLQDIRQKMHFIFFTGGYFSYFDQIKQDDDVQLIFAFAKYNDDYVLIMNLEEMQAPGNDRVTFNGASVIFNSEEEIDKFLNKITPDSIRRLSVQNLGK